MVIESKHCVNSECEKSYVLYQERIATPVLYDPQLFDGGYISVPFSVIT